MAGTGPPPKPASQRRRRNVQPASVTLPSKGRRGRAPEPRTDVEWGEVAKAYWKAIWASPMGVALIDTDVFPLSRLCSLVDRRERVENGDVEVFQAAAFEGEVTVVRGFDGDAEIRQLEDRYGLSPIARRRLQWEIGQAEAAKKASPGRARHLRAVDLKVG